MSGNGSLKDKYKLGGDSKPDAFDNADVRPEKYQAFRKDPQVRPVNAMIDFWMRGGNQRAISYNHLYDVEFDPSEGMTLTFSEHLVTIKGHCLDELYRGLKRHRIVFVWEADSPSALLSEEDEPAVTSIRVQPRFESPGNFPAQSD